MFKWRDVYYINLILIKLLLHCFDIKIFLHSSKLWSIKLRNICLTKLLPAMTSIYLNYSKSFWLFRKCIKTCFCMRKQISQDWLSIFDALKTKDRKIRGNCKLVIKVRFHELEWSSLLIFCILKKKKSLWLCFKSQRKL